MGACSDQVELRFFTLNSFRSFRRHAFFCFRHGAHNWEGPGALTTLTALEKLADVINGLDWIPDKPSAHHVILAGAASKYSCIDSIVIDQLIRNLL